MHIGSFYTLPVGLMLLLQIVDPQLRNIPVDRERLRRFHAELECALDRLEDTFLSAGCSYIAGSDDVTLADVVAVCQLTQAAAAGYDVVRARPQVAAWLPRIKTRLEPHFDVLSAPLYDAKKGLQGRFYQCESFDL